jgi:hypothetical protein
MTAMTPSNDKIIIGTIPIIKVRGEIKNSMPENAIARITWNNNNFE